MKSNIIQCQCNSYGLYNSDQILLFIHIIPGQLAAKLQNAVSSKVILNLIMPTELCFLFTQ